MIGLIIVFLILELCVICFGYLALIKNYENFGPIPTPGPGYPDLGGGRDG